MFKGLGNFASLIKQAQQMGGQMQEVTEQLKHERATGVAGGGMVEIDVNGAQEILACRIDPQLFAQGDRELIEDLVVAATSQALTKAKQLHADALKSMAGNMNIPGMEEALAKLSGEEGPPAE